MVWAVLCSKSLVLMVFATRIRVTKSLRPVGWGASRQKSGGLGSARDPGKLWRNRPAKKA